MKYVIYILISVFFINSNSFASAPKIGVTIKNGVGKSGKNTKIVINKNTIVVDDCVKVIENNKAICMPFENTKEVKEQIRNGKDKPIYVFKEIKMAEGIPAKKTYIPNGDLICAANTKAGCGGWIGKKTEVFIKDDSKTPVKYLTIEDSKDNIKKVTIGTTNSKKIIENIESLENITMVGIVDYEKYSKAPKEKIFAGEKNVIYCANWQPLCNKLDNNVCSEFGKNPVCKKYVMLPVLQMTEIKTISTSDMMKISIQDVKETCLNEDCAAENVADIVDYYNN